MIPPLASSCPGSGLTTHNQTTDQTVGPWDGCAEVERPNLISLSPSDPHPLGQISQMFRGARGASVFFWPVGGSAVVRTVLMASVGMSAGRHVGTLARPAGRHWFRQARVTRVCRA